MKGRSSSNPRTGKFSWRWTEPGARTSEDQIPLTTHHSLLHGKRTTRTHFPSMTVYLLKSQVPFGIWLPNAVSHSRIGSKSKMTGSNNTKVCLVCRAHRSRRRLRCQLCQNSRALPNCYPQHCYIHGFRACRDCAVTFICLIGEPTSRRNSGTPFPMGVADVVISFL